LAIDVPIESNHEVPSEPCHLWLDPTDAKIGWPTLLADSDGVCTLNEITALQPRKVPALVDTRKQGFGAAESTILHLSGSQAAQCFDNDSRHLLPICTAHGARDHPILGPIPIVDEQDCRT
jgi:hypothetical protein